MRGDRPGARARASELARVAREHDLALFGAIGEFLVGWATADGAAPPTDSRPCAAAPAACASRTLWPSTGSSRSRWPRLKPRAGDPDRAVAILDEALATCDRTGYRAFEAELHRARGEILLLRDLDNPALAEEAFHTAMAVAKRQATRSFELRAALSLAKLYQSTGRPAEAHAVLAPALEGFSPTSEMSEFAEAQAMLAALGR